MACAAIVGIGTVAALALAFGIGAAEAGKPGGGGGGPGGGSGVDTGLVYYYTANTQTTWSMNPDGSGKTALPAAVRSVGRGQVSRALHAGHRWFLCQQKFAGELYPGGESTDVRKELFAVRDDGAVVRQLTFQTNLESFGARWSPGDTAISWEARRWPDGGWAGGVRDPVQLYTSAVTFDGNGDVLGLASQPAAPTVSLSGVGSHDWSPDGSRLVAATIGIPRALWIVELGSGAATQLTTAADPMSPAWSPDGTRIAFEGLDGTLRTIGPDGAGESVLISRKGKDSDSLRFSAPEWSPLGTHLVFTRDEGTGRADVYRIAAGGGSTTNLTGDLNTALTPAVNLAWR